MNAPATKRLGRPRIGTVITVRIPDELLARLDADAARAGITRADAIRAMISHALGPAKD